MGVLDKNQFGASPYGLVHACYELYGPKTSGLLLTALGKLFVFYLQMVGFSCGVDDLLLNKEGETIRKNKLQEALKVGVEGIPTFIVTRYQIISSLGQLWWNQVSEQARDHSEYFQETSK